MKTPTVKLHNGTTIPQIGLGLWKVRLKAVCQPMVRDALETGYRHFDTAQIYGNEKYLGNALHDSGIARDKLFITTKIWNWNQQVDRLQPSFQKSLEHLRTDYVNLLLLHFPVTKTRREAWPEMEKIYASGQAKAIGVSNYTIRHLEELLDTCSVKPMVNQVELHVFLQQPELLSFCKAHDIVVEAYSPLAHGQGLDDPILQSIAKKHDKSTAQIMLRWCLEVGTIPLPKSTHAERQQENIDIFDFKLDKHDMSQLESLNKEMRTCWDPTDTP